MKNILKIFVLFICVQNSFCQVGIYINPITSSAILDFETGKNKGIVLPIVESLSTSIINGTILMDKTDKKVKMRQNDAWVNLTTEGNITNVVFNTSAESLNNGVVIGASSTAATGVLILESTTKALVLPKVASPHLNIKSPVAGMICYDTTSNTMAIFDGLSWHYWK